MTGTSGGEIESDAHEAKGAQENVAVDTEETANGVFPEYGRGDECIRKAEPTVHAVAII